MNIKKLFFIFSAFAVSCSTNLEEGPIDKSQNTNNQQLSIGVSQSIDSRTSIDQNDLSSVRWADGDCLYLWSSSTEDAASSYLFECAEFKMKYFSPTYDQAIFIADVAPMEMGEYNYFGVYPEPSSCEGSQVTFTMPTEQSGRYDGKLDIMAANPTTGAALEKNPSEDLSLSFRHLAHAIRVNIPEDRNIFGDEIARLDVTFPSAVVGDLSFDAANVDAQPTLSNGSNKIILNFEKGISEGEDYAWIFVAPSLVQGVVTFQAYNSLGESSHTIAVDVDKNMEAGRITPMTLTVPEGLDTSYLNFQIGENKLGETIQKIIVTAPAGAQFDNGSATIELPYSAENRYCATYTTSEYGDKFKAGSLSIKLESESAIVNGEAINLRNIIQNNTWANQFTCDVPYLMYNDFSATKENFEHYSDPGGSSTGTGHTIELGQYNLPGWTGDRVGGVKNTSIRTLCRLEGGLGVQARYQGRIDSEPLSALKDGKSVTIKVTYNYSGSENEYTGSADGTAKYWHGYTSTSGSISGSKSIEHTVGGSMGTGTDGGYSSIKREGTFTSLADKKCSNKTRISWKVDVDRAKEFAQGGNYWLYIDNVKVEIVK